ncbi:MAG: sugar transferase [Coriobacteriia bacterium]|nr:sugar transferase [Coriobacteriia bacterium]
MTKSRFIALSLFVDAILVNVGFVCAFALRFAGHLPEFNFRPYVVLAPLVTLVYLAVCYINELYEPERVENEWAVVRAVLAAVTVGTLLFSAIAFFAGPAFSSIARVVIILSWFTVSALLVSWRLLFLRFSAITWPEQRVLLLGEGPLGRELATELDRRAKWGYRVVGFVSAGVLEGTGVFESVDVPANDGTPTSAAAPESTNAPASVDAPGHPVLGQISDITRIIAENDVDRLIITSPVAIRELVEDLVLAREISITIDVVPRLYEVFISSVDGMVGDIPLMQITRKSVPAWLSTAKRMADVVGAVALFAVLSPVLLAAAAAVLVSMGWPVIFAQERVGRELKPFRMYKFRTMIRDAESASGPVLAKKDDVRVTPLGRVLRRSRIDELPQLVNILRGEMSFVGPRPERPYFVERHLAEIPGYHERFRVAPGVTGFAQVMGGYATTPERKLKYDLIYLYHQSLTTDMQIVVETLRVVLTGRGAQ